MTPVPFELPLRPSEAAAVADLLFQQVEGRPLTDDQRGRFAGRLTSLETPTIMTFPGSLTADPIHGSTYYLAVDGHHHNTVTPLLLRIGLASAPATGLFPKSLMIGRVRPHGQREVVISAVPFGPSDHDTIRTFAENVDKAFLPRPHGAQPTQIVRTDTNLAAAFESFKTLPKNSHPVVETSEFWAAVWAAIRAGRRDGFGVGTVIDVRDGLAGALRHIEERPLFTQYVLECREASEAIAVMDHVRRVKSGLASLYGRAVDFELRLSHSGAIPQVVTELKSEGRVVQAVSAGQCEFTPELLDFLRGSNVPVVLDGEAAPVGIRVSQRRTI